MQTIRLNSFLILSFCFHFPAFAVEPLDSIIKEKLGSQDETVQSQQRIDILSEETQDIEQEYKTLLRSSEGLKTYNEQLQSLTNKQKEQLASIERQLGHVEETQRNIIPLMLRMIDVLEEFIALDAPFLTEERQTRLDVINNMMDRPDVTLPDKFRRVMEAYQIEMEYGRTIETYTASIDINGQFQTVDLLRIGRVALLYSSLDQSSVGQWDTKQKIWMTLDKRYKRSIQQGLKIANKQAPPELFKIPVQAPEATE